MKPISTRAFAIGAVVAIVVFATIVSQFASSSPDGLERVAIDRGFDGAATDHALADGPAADYELGVAPGEAWSAAAAGLVGVVVTFAIGAGIVAMVRRNPDREHLPVS